MEIAELQINDWVSIKNGFPMQVVGLYKDVAYLDFEGNEGDMWEVDEKDLCPIPITLEILEKNGFKKELGLWGNGFGFPYYIREDIDEYDLVILSWEGEDTCVLSIKYIHELQHALKLCKIDKEITL